jgi:hypothetical protein
MRPITNFALHALAAAVLTAFAASSAAAQYLALGDSIPAPSGAKESREKWIEIQNWQWGSTSAAKFGAVGGMHRDADMTLKGSQVHQNMRESGEKGGTIDMNIGVGELQEGPAPTGGVRVASGDVDGDPVLRNVEKRQHGWTTVSKPLDRGSVRVKVKFPWVGCAVGAHYPVITLGDAANSYRLQDVTVASCAGGGTEGPEESITFVYGKLGAKTQVRGWDPEKKEN